MEIKQISLKIDSDLLEKIDKDAEKEVRNRNKQVIFMLQKYYEMKELLKQ